MGLESADPARLQPGDAVGPFRIGSLLGEGAMGVVFKAWREPDGQIVALKLLKRKLLADETYSRRFVHEARSAQQVRHRNLATVVEAGEVDGYRFIALEYVEGPTLESRISSEGALPVVDILILASQIGSGLDALHTRGVLHRDVKPSNILLAPDGRAALTDFGLAKGRAYTALTRQGQVIGTLQYLAPELIRGSPASSASDIYAMGCVVFECLTTRPPFAHRSAFQIGLAHLEEEPADLSEGRADISPDLGRAVLSALEKDPAMRPATATAYANAMAVARGQERM